MGPTAEQRNFRHGETSSSRRRSRRKKGKKKTFKEEERKHIPHGLVHVQASFDDTIVTITDSGRNMISSKSCPGSLGLLRIA